MISKLRVQCARQPGACRACSRRCFGSTQVILHIATEPSLVEPPFGEAMHTYPDSIPLGICDVRDLDDWGLMTRARI
ncbi:CASTOR/POLLUX-related putative ion channel [Halochromatium sp.]